MDIAGIRRQFADSADRGDDFAVLLPLFEREGELFVLFEIRSRNIPQGGEVCFPGGHVEEGESGKEAAVRETCEELLIASEQVEVIGKLRSAPHFRQRGIEAYVGFLNDYENTFSSEEAESVFALGLEELLDIKPRVSSVTYRPEYAEDYPFELIPGGRNYPFRVRKTEMYFYETEQALIWGLTASVLHRFLEECRPLYEEKNG